jgi:restriction system protein
MRRLDPILFEELVLSALADFGYRIRRNRRYSGDGGIDGWVFYSGAWCPIQCKRYSRAIDPSHVSEFSTLVNRIKTPTGFFIHTGRTGAYSVNAASEGNKRIMIISGDRLRELVAGPEH